MFDNSNDGNGWARGQDEGPSDGSTEPQPAGHCPKCEHEEIDLSSLSIPDGNDFAPAGDGGSHFSIVTCDDCGYSEFYRGTMRREIVQRFLVTGE